jgi:phospholipid-binding lipoprotein MlaA
MSKPGAVLGRCVLLLWLWPALPALAADDPFERVNRGVLRFNDFLDRLLVRPLAVAYHAVLPDACERAVQNFFVNLAAPAVALNQLVQGKPGLALEDTARFAVNSTFGIGGLFDVAERAGLAVHEEDCSQTLAVWGAGSGPYIVLPLLGPATVQTALGGICNRALDPVSWMHDVRWRNSLSGLSLLDTRVQLLAAESLITGDRYVFIRDAFLQRREYLNQDGQVADPFLDDDE